MSIKTIRDGTPLVLAGSNEQQAHAMEHLFLTVSDDCWEELKRHLSEDELQNLDRYLADIVGKDLFERRRKRLEDQVRQELRQSGANLVFALDIEEFARDPQGVATYLIRSGEPATLLIDGKPTLIVQDVRNVTISAWEAFGKRRS